MRLCSIIIAGAGLLLGQTAGAIDLLATDKAIIDSGRGLYGQHCATCHGKDARGP